MTNNLMTNDKTKPLRQSIGVLEDCFTRTSFAMTVHHGTSLRA